MISSMTGFGRANLNNEHRNITIEIKSVNHRYFEISSKISRKYMFIEQYIKPFVNEKIKRGKVDLYINIQDLKSENIDIEVNEPLLEQYIKSINFIKDKYNVVSGVTAKDLSLYPEVILVKDQLSDEEEIWNEVKPVLKKSLDNLLNMRKAEGLEQYNDLIAMKDNILKKIDEIEKISPKSVEDYSIKLKNKIEEILQNNKIDEQRILTEVALFADKVAVEEEISRLRSHFKQMNEILTSGKPVGRKLDFLVQEMNREINTIGSKATNIEIAHIVVDVKSEIEKIREQVQNIE